MPPPPRRGAGGGRARGGAPVGVGWRSLPGFCAWGVASLLPPIWAPTSGHPYPPPQARATCSTFFNGRQGWTIEVPPCRLLFGLASLARGRTSSWEPACRLLCGLASLARGAGAFGTFFTAFPGLPLTNWTELGGALPLQAGIETIGSSGSLRIRPVSTEFDVIHGRRSGPGRGRTPASAPVPSSLHAASAYRGGISFRTRCYAYG